MFGSTYYGPTYFGSSYWGTASVAASPPTVVSPIESLTVTEGTTTNVRIDTSFDDEQLGDLSFAITAGDQSWLSLSTIALPGGSQTILTLTPLAGDSAGSPYVVTITATDDDLASTSDTFKIKVKPASLSWGDILQALRIKALVDDFEAAFGVRMFIMQAPPRTELPYAVMVPVDTVPFSTFSEDGGMLRVQVSLYGDDSDGGMILARYATFLRKNLSRVALPVLGFEVLGVDYDIERGPFRDGDRWRYDADYIVRFLET